MSESGIDDFRRAPDGVLAAGLKTLARFDLPLGVHAESHEMVERLGAELRAAGRSDRLAWCRARPPAAEWRPSGGWCRACVAPGPRRACAPTWCT